MNIDRIVMAFGGLMIIVTAALGVYVHEYWHYFTMFIGLNFLQSAFTGFCPLAIILKKMNKPAGAAFYGQADTSQETSTGDSKTN